jgi:hypothetical protein
MAERLAHRDIQQLVNGLSDARIVNLDASVKELVQPIAEALPETGGEVGLHVLCCNEYFLVTGITGEIEAIRDIALLAERIRKDLG